MIRRWWRRVWRQPDLITGRYRNTQLDRIEADLRQIIIALQDKK